MDERREFIQWLIDTYGAKSKIAAIFIEEMNKGMAWPPKKKWTTLKGYDWEKYYNAWKNPTKEAPPQIPGVPYKAEGIQRWEGGTTGEEEAKKFGGYSLEEWGLGVPQFQAEQEYRTWQMKESERDRAQREAELGTQRQIAQWGAQGAASQAAATQLQTGWLGAGGGATAQRLSDQEVLARQWDEFVKLLEPTPRNWIATWRGENLPNPFRHSQDDAAIQLQMATEELEIAESLMKHVKGWEKAAESPDISLSAQQKDLIQVAKDRYARANEFVTDIESARLSGMEAARTGQPIDYSGKYTWQAEAGYWSTPRQVSETIWAQGKPGVEDPKKAGMPALPGWMAKATGLATVPETRQSIARPSGQTWASWGPSQREMYGGLADWASDVPYEDVLASAQSQLTQPLSLGRSWRVAR